MSRLPVKPPKKMTRQRLHNIAVAYVQRYGGSARRVGQVLARRADRSLRYHDELARKEEVADWIAEVVAGLQNSGLVDDGRQARAAAIRDSLAGRPLRVIAMRLRQKGFGGEDIDMAVAAVRQPDADGAQADADLVACCRYARRRGLGPFRSPGAKQRSRDSQLGALMRAGFAYRYAVRVLDEPTPEALLELLDGAALPRLTP